MIPLRLKEISAVLGAACGEDKQVLNICTDTRKITQGSLFIALVGEIDASADLETRFEQLYLAKQAESKADASIKGVSEAKAILKDASIAYSATIAEVNSSFTGIVNGATGIAETVQKSFQSQYAKFSITWEFSPTPQLPRKQQQRSPLFRF